jgi:hypothetical protein
LSAGETETHSINAGTGSDRVLIALIGWRDRANTITGVTYNGVAMTEVTAKITNSTAALHVFKLVNPASGANDLAVTMSSGASNSSGLISAWVANGVDQTTPVDGVQTGSGGASTASIVSQPSSAVTSAVGDRVVAAHFFTNDSQVSAAAASGYSERQDADTGTGFAIEFGDADGDASVTVSAQWNNGAGNNCSWASIGFNVNAVEAGGDDLTWLAQSHVAGSASNRAVASGFTPPESPE